MASKYTTNELVREGPADESDSEDDFDGYVNDDNTSVKSQQHDCEDDHFDGYVNDDNTSVYHSNMTMRMIKKNTEDMTMIQKMRKMMMKMMYKVKV